MALGMFWLIYGFTVFVGVFSGERLRNRNKTVSNIYLILTKFRMHNSNVHLATKKGMPEKIYLILSHYFIDIVIGGGLAFTFIQSIGDWQAVVSLSVLIMFAVLRGKALLEDIANKREDRRKKEIENREREFDLKVKEDKYNDERRK